MQKIAVFLLSLSLFLSLLNPQLVRAQEEESNRSITISNDRYDLPSARNLNESKARCKGKVCADNMMNFQLNALAGAGACVVGGTICGAETAEEEQGYIKRSMIGQTTNYMAMLYEQKPASTMEYLAWMGNKAGIIPKTYAQGLTFSRLLPIIPIWQAFRDIAFIMLAIIMLMIGVMIMFRAKVNPQTVASVENAIPRVIVTIILIWFSFPIASVIIDFMYVLIAAGIGVIGKAVNDPTVTQQIQDYTTGGFTTLFGKVLQPLSAYNTLGDGGGSFSKLGVWGGLVILPFNGIAYLVTAIGSAIVGGIATGTQTGDAGTGIMTALSPLFILIIFIVLFFQIFKIFFMLLNAYIQIMISIIIAPVYLLANAIPGKNTFSSWWKGIVGNMLTFVVTAIMLYMGYAIALTIQARSFWTPPFIAAQGGAAAGVISQSVVGLITLGIILLIPQVVNMVKQTLGVKPTFNVGPSMVLGPTTNMVTQGMSTITSFHGFSQGLQTLKDSRFSSWIPGLNKK